MRISTVLIGVVSLLLTISCSTNNTPTEEPATSLEVMRILGGPSFRTPPSLDLQIFDADIIVVATLVSASPVVKPLGDYFEAGHTLRFRSSEYLKGIGPSEFVIEVPIVEYAYADRPEALAAARSYLGQRDTKYDNRPGVLFLNGPLAAPTFSQDDSVTGSGGERTSSTPATAFNFIPGHLSDTDSWQYSIDTKERVWMPAKSTSTTDTSSRANAGTSATEYITDGQASPPSVISLSDLRSRISAMTTRLEQNSGIAGFKECVRGSLINERVSRNREVTIDPFTIDSGTDPSSQALIGINVAYGDSVYWNFIESGADEGYFDVTIIDNDDDPARYGFEYRPNRPLPAGLYKTGLVFQLPEDMPCNFIPFNPFDMQVTVTAPAGTLHEAFFDPVTIGTAVGAGASNGVLKPTAFTLGQTSTQITGLKWENNQAVLTLSPHLSLASSALDIIELDGSVSLTLNANDATVDATAGTHTWSVTTQPWHDGDKLMLRLRQIPAPPAFASDTYNFTVAENAKAFTVIGTALATDPNAGDQPLHTITAGNEDGKFQIDGFAGFILVWKALDYETKSTYALTVKADDGKGGVATTTVNITLTDVEE